MTSKLKSKGVQINVSSEEINKFECRILLYSRLTVVDPLPLLLNTHF